MDDRFHKIRLNQKIVKRIMESAAAFKFDKSKLKLPKQKTEADHLSKKKPKLDSVKKIIKKEKNRSPPTKGDPNKPEIAKQYNSSRGNQNSAKPNKRNRRRSRYIERIINKINGVLEHKSLISEINEQFFRVDSGESLIFYFEILAICLKDSIAMEVFQEEVEQLRHKFRRLEGLLKS